MKVWSVVPDSWKDPIEKAKEMEGWNSLSAYIKELIKIDLKRKGFFGVKPENREKETVMEEG